MRLWRLAALCVVSATRAPDGRSMQLIHIPKTGVTSLEQDLRARGVAVEPLNERCYAAVRREGPVHGVMLRAPRAHVRSMYMQCRYAPASSSITTHFAGFPGAPRNDTEGLRAWLDHFGANWSHAGRGDFGCYTPLDHQCHHLACADGGDVCPGDAAAAADYARDPLKTNARRGLPAPRGAGLCTPASHHRAGGAEDAWPRAAELAAALRALDAIEVVGLVEHYEASLCLFAYFALGALPADCACDAAADVTRARHGVPDYEAERLPGDVVARIDAVTAMDRALYDRGQERFFKHVRQVERAAGARVLCGTTRRMPRPLAGRRRA